ncbi:MAG: response regulator [Maioricimonas sp. JB045]|uniref:response regulator n=1 Tax=Maioricimonas sp. JC845 TaxID=3232138 RepID=UPI00345B0A00
MSELTPSHAIVNRVLIVEDDRDEAEFLKSFLEERRFGVEVARDGGQAHAAFTMHRPDFVILDVILPNNVSGFEVCEQLKRLDDGVPVMMLTAIDMDDARQLAQRVGADGYLTKPYDPEALVEQIHALSEEIWSRRHLEPDAATVDSKVRFECPDCGKRLKVSGTHRGRTLNCPRCGQPVKVPLHD